MCHKNPCNLLGGRRGKKCPFCLRKTNHGCQTSVTRKTSICQTNDVQNSLISRLREIRIWIRYCFWTIIPSRDRASCVNTEGDNNLYDNVYPIIGN